MTKACYAFKCSEQMDYKGMGDIFKGLGASGFLWCFDKFDPLDLKALSVSSMKFKCVIDGLKRLDKEFIKEEKNAKIFRNIF